MTPPLKQYGMYNPDPVVTEVNRYHRLAELQSTIAAVSASADRLSEKIYEGIADAEAAIKADEAQPSPEPPVKTGEETTINAYNLSPEPPDGYMCPNCVTPWKCNGPHIPEPASEPQGQQISDEKRCPFCNEGEFDGVGLKGHLQQEDCKEYRDLTAPLRLFALLREAPAGWRQIESAPKMRKVIAGYRNASGNWRTVTAKYYLPETLECSSNDTDWCEEGWYEESDSVETIMPTNCPPTHWVPLPAAPKEGA